MVNSPKIGRIIGTFIVIAVILVAVFYAYSSWVKLQYSQYQESRNSLLYSYNYYISSIEDVLLNEGFSEDGISDLNFYAKTTLDEMILDSNELPTTVFDSDLYTIGRENLLSDQEALEMHRELEEYIHEYQGVYGQVNAVSAFRACIADIDLSVISSKVASASINSCLGEFEKKEVSQEYLGAYASDLRSYWSLSSELYAADGSRVSVTALSNRVKAAQIALDQSKARWEANKEVVLNVSDVERILSTQ